MFKNKYCLAVLAGFVIGFIAPSIVSAQQPSGLTVTPGVIKTVVSKETPIQDTRLTIRNNYEVPVRLSAEIKGIDETTPQLLPSDNLDSQLRDVLGLSETDLSIPPRTDKQIILQARYSESLKPGGHYATVVLTEQSASGANLSLRSSVSVNVFLTNQEGVKETFELKTFQAASSLFSLPQEAAVELVNAGNVHSVPRGVVRVERLNGSVLAKGLLNSGSRPILPGQSFSAKVPLSDNANSYWPQKIRTVLEFHGDGSSQLTEVSKASWYIPPGFIGLVVLIIAVTVLFIRFGLNWTIRSLRGLKGKFRSKKHKKRINRPVQIHDVVKMDKKQR